MTERILMSIDEAKRLEVIKRVDKDILTMRQAKEELGVSLRQAKRIRKCYLSAGEAGLISRKRGRTSNRKIKKDTLLLDSHPQLSIISPSVVTLVKFLAKHGRS